MLIRTATADDAGKFAMKNEKRLTKYSKNTKQNSRKMPNKTLEIYQMKLENSI